MAGRIFPGISAHPATLRADRTRIFRSFTICVQTVSNKTSSSSISNAFLTKTKLTTDWGFRISGVYGLDYRFMISRGLFSDQLLKDNNYYGFDMPMVYFDLYLPQIFQGMNIRIGRIISEPDIEAQLAPNNLMSSHSLVYGVDNYTQTGIFTTTKINDQWTIQLGLSNGTDVALWQKDPGNQPTGTVMIQWTSPNQKDSVYVGDNAFNNGEFGYNNLQ